MLCVFIFAHVREWSLWFLLSLMITLHYFPPLPFFFFFLIYLGLKKSKIGAEILPLLLNSRSWETALPFHGDFLLLETLEAKLEGRPPLSSLLSSWQTELSTSCQVGAHGTGHIVHGPPAWGHHPTRTPKCCSWILLQGLGFPRG